MSPVSRGRKVKRSKRSARRAARPYEVGAQDGCQCPSCSAADLDPQRLVDELVDVGTGLTQSEDPLDAEIMGATLMSIAERADEGLEGLLVRGLIPGFEARAGSEALAMLLAIGAVAGERVAQAASAAVERLVHAGVSRPGWAAELGAPVSVANCWRLADSGGTASMLACSFQRAGRGHAFVISVDHLDCGAASDIALLDADQLADALEMMRAEGRAEGLKIISEALDAVEFRWHVEDALEARAVHDGLLTDEETADLPTGEDGPGYPALAVLLRARMNSLPKPSKPAVPHGDGDEELVGVTARQILAQLARDGGGPFGGGMPTAARGRRALPALPAERKRSDRPAPVYQIKVGLRGVTPPIWRRLEVPADISLARLHTIIQIAFGWDDSHLHAFETPYGSFGDTDDGSGRRAETSVTLEQVAPAVNSKFRYTYDFGDNWDHDILVEKVLAQSGTDHRPRCTGGRRAAPPEDCGGVWGYDELVQVLNDPSDEEHEDRLEWLGLDAAAQFDPARFDAEEVTRALSFVH